MNFCAKAGVVILSIVSGRTLPVAIIFLFYLEIDNRLQM
jgi:hypothetical protein